MVSPGIITRRQTGSQRAPMTPPIDPEALATAREDASLVARIAQGDRVAFAELYDRFNRPLFATALRILREPTDAEDVVHDIFLVIWEKASTFDPSRGSAFAWAVTLTRNKSIDRQRSRVRRADLLNQAPVEDLPVGANSVPSDSADSLWVQEKAAAVRSAIRRLPPEQQKALELAYFSGLTQQEISERLKEPLGTVKARIRRGLLKLRDVLAERI